jgi:hypothetical protein
MFFKDKIKKLTVSDIQMIKLSVFAFTLMLAALWPRLVTLLPWWGWLIIFILAGLKPLSVLCRKR